VIPLAEALADRSVVPAAIDLRVIALPDEADPADADLLSADETERAERLRSPVARAAFVTMRAALRRALADHLGTAPRDIRFASSGRGKPVLADRDTPCTSVAHTDGLGVLVIASRAVGVDIERIEPDRWDRGVAARVLSPTELAWLEAQPDRDAAFFRCWVRKEAFVKVGDGGLVDDLVRLTLTPVVDDTLTGPIDVVDLPLRDDRYVLAVAVTPVGELRAPRRR
jgi:4'-phosphopantetheinyl transferase